MTALGQYVFTLYVFMYVCTLYVCMKCMHVIDVKVYRRTSCSCQHTLLVESFAEYMYRPYHDIFFEPFITICVDVFVHACVSAMVVPAVNLILRFHDSNCGVFHSAFSNILSSSKHEQCSLKWSAAKIAPKHDAVPI